MSSVYFDFMLLCCNLCSTIDGMDERHISWINDMSFGLFIKISDSVSNTERNASVLQVASFYMCGKFAI
jgi:hypothetical protein